MHLEGTIASHGAGEAATGPVESLTINGCTNGYAKHVRNNGSLSIASSGVVTSANTEFQSTTPLGINCTYKTAASGTTLGTLTDS